MRMSLGILAMTMTPMMMTIYDAAWVFLQEWFIRPSSGNASTLLSDPGSGRNTICQKDFFLIKLHSSSCTWQTWNMSKGNLSLISWPKYFVICSALTYIQVNNFGFISHLICQLGDWCQSISHRNSMCAFLVFATDRFDTSQISNAPSYVTNTLNLDFRCFVMAYNLQI